MLNIYESTSCRSDGTSLSPISAKKQHSFLSNAQLKQLKKAMPVIKRSARQNNGRWSFRHDNKEREEVLKLDKSSTFIYSRVLLAKNLFLGVSAYWGRGGKSHLCVSRTVEGAILTCNKKKRTLIKHAVGDLNHLRYTRWINLWWGRWNKREWAPPLIYKAM